MNPSQPPLTARQRLRRAPPITVLGKDSESGTQWRHPSPNLRSAGAAAAARSESARSRVAGGPVRGPDRSRYSESAELSQWGIMIPGPLPPKSSLSLSHGLTRRLGVRAELAAASGPRPLAQPRAVTDLRGCHESDTRPGWPEASPGNDSKPADSLALPPACGTEPGSAAADS